MPRKNEWRGFNDRQNINGRQQVTAVECGDCCMKLLLDLLCDFH